MPTRTQIDAPNQTPESPIPVAGSGPVPYRLTVRQFEKMIDAGIFRDEDHVELLGGLLVDKMVKYDPHSFTVGEVGELFRAVLPRDWFVREEKSIVLGLFWRPEPDIAVVGGPRERYRTKGPRRADLAMLVEVADSTYVKDRGAKWRNYAAAGVAVYWIVNLPLRQIEVYSAPGGRGKSAGYRDSKIYGAAEDVPLFIEGRELGRFKVSDVLS